MIESVWIEENWIEIKAAVTQRGLFYFNCFLNNRKLNNKEELIEFKGQKRSEIKELERTDIESLIKSSSKISS